jgi:hypothetical protein
VEVLVITSPTVMEQHQVAAVQRQMELQILAVAVEEETLL